MASSDEHRAYSRHDVSLALIPTLFLGGSIVANFSAFGLATILFWVSLPACVLIGYVCFYRPPETSQQ